MILGLGHINIVVEDINKASLYYKSLLNASPVQRFNNFRNSGFSKSAGFMDNFEDVDVSIEFLQVGDTDVFIELMEYHTPRSTSNRFDKKTNMIGGVGHICLKVSNIDDEFSRIKEHHDIRMISKSNDYKPFKISDIEASDFFFYEKEKELDKEAKNEVVNIVSNTRYFYFIDLYGIQWEFEEGHSDIG